MSTTLRDALADEAQFAEAISDATDAIVMVMDLEGRIVHANPFLARLGGFETPGDVVGLDWLSTFIPERAHEAIRELYRRAVAGQAIHRQRTPVIDRLGREHEIEWSARRILGDDGEALGVLSVGIDVTETRFAQQQLAREEARFASVIAGTQDAFILIDGQAQIVAFNPAAETIFGWSAAEVVGEKVNVLMPEPYSTEHDGYIEHYEQTGEARAIGRIRVVQGRRRNGEAFPIELSVTRIGVDGEARYAAFIRDISETVRLRQRAAERQRLAAIGTTSAKFAHEVGNPLNAMLMNLQLIQRRIGKGVPTEQLGPLVERVERGVKRLAALLEEFRSMSRRQAYSLRPVEPRSLLDDFLADHEVEYEARRVRVESECASPLARVHVDREKVAQILLNLAKNAVEAMGEQGGVLRLRVYEDRTHVVFEVADDGPGIPEGVDVFEPFVTTKHEGTGLGLAVARQIAAAHGGDLDYTSAAGAGTTFRLRLPVGVPHESALSLPVVRP